MVNKIVLITQARVGSTRLPSKVLKEIKGKSILEIQLDRVSKSKSINKIIVASPEGDKETPIRHICNKLGIKFTAGSEFDVLDRYYNAAKEENADWVVRITSDCPLIDPELIDKIVNKIILTNLDYGSNTLIETYPDGQDIEVFKFSVLETAYKEAFLKSDREHVTPYIKRNCISNRGNLFSSESIEHDINYSSVRMTVDDIHDFNTIKILVEELGFNASWEEYTKFIISNQLLFENQKTIRNEGYLNSLKNDKK
jgi:spore coat polysaccharide biosynthesis protein SpsF